MPPPVKALRPPPPAVAVAPRDRRPAARGPVTVGADLLRAQAMVGNSAVAAMLQNAPGPVDPGALTGVGRTAAVPDRAFDLAGTGPQPAPTPGLAGTLPPAIALTIPAGPGAAATATAKPGWKATGGAKPLAAAGAPDLTKDGKAAGKQQPGAAKEAAGAGGTRSAQRTPGADPKFQVLKKDVATKKRAVGTSHPPAAAEAGSAQAAAVPPKDDQEARGKVTHAGEMDAAQPKEFDRESFVRAVEEAIARKAPQNLEEADEFGDSGKAEEVKGEVQGKVGDGKDASAAEIETTTAEVPTPAPDAKTVVPMTADRPPGRPAGPNPDLAAPDNLPPDATDLSAGPEQVGQQMADANVTKQQIALPNSKEPSFGKAVQETDKLEKHSEAAPAALRGAENREIKAVKGAAGAQGQTAMGAMHGTRVGTGQQVTAGKTGTKSTDEQKRAQVTAKLQTVFDATKTAVEKILRDLDGKVDKEFTDGEKQARDRFVRDHKEGMRRYKAERYSGFWGPGKWLKDRFLPLPDEANRIYERARDTYIAAMKQVIIRISYTVESSLRQAKDRISLGRTQLTATVEALPADLKAIGQSAAAEFADRFSELQDTVNEKGTELVQTVTDRYTEAVKQVDDLIAKEKEKNKGLLAKAVDAVKGVIDTIIELKNMLMGMLRKAVAAIGAILKDPIGFLKNLISAVGGGLKLFMKNIGKHMQAGVLQWLLGTASSVGLQLPAKFDTRGIVQVLAMLLGLSWANIRGRITRKAPEPAVRAAETGVPLVAAVKKQGVGGMWSDLQSRVGDLKKDLISKVVKYLTPTIIIAGITWILSLLNPASAFIRACKMIIDIVRFIVTQGRQIIEFVNSVLDAVLAIARGGAGGVPGLVERALARSIPVLIGALAAILGIGGIAGKVKQIFQTLAKPVNRAIDWVIEKIVGLIKKLWAKLKAKKPKRPRPLRPSLAKPRRPKRPDKPRRPGRRGDERRKPEKPEKFEGVLVKSGLTMSGARHTLMVTVRGRHTEIDLASSTDRVRKKVAEALGRLNGKDLEREQSLRDIDAAAVKLQATIDANLTRRGNPKKNLLPNPQFKADFADLKQRIEKYGAAYGATDLTMEDLGQLRIKLEKEVRDRLLSLVRRHDTGQFSGLGPKLDPAVRASAKLNSHLAFDPSKPYPEWAGVGLIEGSTFRVVDRYTAPSGRTYEVLAGDVRQGESAEAIAAFNTLVDATQRARNALDDPVTLARALTEDQLEGGKRQKFRRAQYAGSILEKRVANDNAVDALGRLVEHLGTDAPGVSVPDFVIHDTSGDIPIDITGAASVTGHVRQRAYLARAGQVIDYRRFDDTVLDQVFS